MLDYNTENHELAFCHNSFRAFAIMYLVIHQRMRFYVLYFYYSTVNLLSIKMLIPKCFTKYAKMFINYLIKLLKHKKDETCAQRYIRIFWIS